MPCYFPINAWRAKSLNENGKRPITFDIQDAYIDMPITVNCGQCIGCKLERSRQWAIRCFHESSLYDENCFITLTYKDKYLPFGGTLVKAHFQKFMKRLRRLINGTRRISYFHCGEYGPSKDRPHYHACLFNYDFSDRVFLKKINGNDYYISETLAKLWPYGFSTITDVTFKSAAYVARYIVKKQLGSSYEIDLAYCNKQTGLIKEKEYITMSRRPGLGQKWYDKYKKDVFPCDNVVIEGRKYKVPDYYTNQLSELDKKAIKAQRNKLFLENKSLQKNSSQDRLYVRAECQELNLKKIQEREKELCSIL